MKKILIIVFSLLVLSFILLMWSFPGKQTNPDPRLLFTEYVMSEVPRGVTFLKTSGGVGFASTNVSMEIKIDDKDWLDVLVKDKKFTMINGAKFDEYVKNYTAPGFVPSEIYLKGLGENGIVVIAVDGGKGVVNISM